MRQVVKPLLAAAVLLAAATACNDDDASGGDTAPDAALRSPGASTETTEPTREADGVLTIGVLLPQTGDGAPLGNPGTAAARLAVNEINEAGGVLGEDVVLLPADEGETLEQAGQAIDDLLAHSVDAIVGPASSLVALNYLDDLMDARVLTCSPLATSLALDDYPNRDLFFRTIASDSMAADGLALQAQRTGVTTATVVYVDDAFGRPFARDVMSSLQTRDVQVRPEVPLSASDDDYRDEASSLAESEPGTIIIVADSVHGWMMLHALEGVFDEPPRIVVNDAMRQPPSAEDVTALSDDFRTAIEGISPLGTPGANEPAGPFATNSYECVNVIALAAVEAGTDDAVAIAAEVRDVASRGAGCNTFAECLEQINKDREIDYNGPRQRFSIGQNGDPAFASLMLFGFNESGIATDLGGVRID